MNKLLKIILIAAGVAVVLVIAAIVAVAVFFDPNAFRGRITAEVKAATGRELTIGDIHLSVFPTLGARIRNAQFGNAPGFGSDPFARVTEAEVGVKLLPLVLHRVVQVDSISVDGLALNLEKNAKGETNWDDLAERGKTAPPQTPEGTPAAQAPPASGSRIQSIDIGGIGITNAGVTLRDAQAGKTYSLSKLKLKTGAIAPGKPFDLDLAFSSALGELTGAAGVTADTDLSATLDFDVARKRFSAHKLKAELTASGAQIPGGKQKAELSADLDYDGSAGTFKLAGATLKAGGLEATATLDGSGFGGEGGNEGAGRFSGPLSLKPFSPRELLKAFAIPLRTADENALKQASLSAQLEGNAKSAQFRNFSLTLDETHVTGDFGIDDFATQAVRFALKLDAIDADRYLPPDSATAKPTGEAAKNPAAGDAQVLPVDGLDALNAAGTLDIGKFKIHGLSMSDAHLKLALPKGAPKQIDLASKLYGGSLDSSTRIVTGSRPAYAQKLKLNSIAAEPLLKDFNGTDRLSGTGNVALDINTLGRTVGDLKRALDGSVSMSFTNGAVKGFNLADIVRRGQSLLNGQTQTGDASQQTDFASLSASGKFTDGVLRSNDLNAMSPLFRLAGEGQVNLPSRSIDYIVKPTFVNTTSGQGGKALADLSGVMIPVHVTGSFDEPHYALDLQSALTQKAAQKLLDKVQNGKLGNQINDALGKLFGNKPQNNDGDGSKPPPQ